MRKFHINPRTGMPAECEALTKCPFGDLVTDHFGSFLEAQKEQERRMSANIFPSFEQGRILTSPLNEGMKNGKNSFIVPKGVYMIGDPYYIAGRDHKAWGEWVTEANNNPEDNAVGLQYNGYPVLGFRTAGEGLYYDSQGRPYNSSSGVIGLVPASLARQMGIEELDALDDANLITFFETTSAEWTDGAIYFGDVLFVKTDPDFNDLDDDPVFDDEDEFDSWLNEDDEDEDSVIYYPSKGNEVTDEERRAPFNPIDYSDF